MVSWLRNNLASLNDLPWADIGTLTLVLAVVPVALVGRWVYVSRYLRRQLFFEPWLNLSGDSDLDLGASLSEILYFELQSLHKLLQRARNDRGLWNERSLLPVLERLSDGEPNFLRDVDLLGLPGGFRRLLQFVTRPQRMRGSIHQFGKDVRLQVVLEGVGQNDRQGWSRTVSTADLGAIPAAVSLIVHEIVIDLGNVAAFKSAEGFIKFTQGLREHLSYNELHGRTECRVRAKAFYREAIGAEGGNPLASYALAELLYSEYEESPNKEAILSYQEALQSDAPELRSRAFRGLADAYCQTVHRHRRGGPESLEEAKRYAEFALEECQSQDNGKRSRSWFLEHAPWAQITKQDFSSEATRHEATVRKALAFAIQMTAVKLKTGQKDESDADESQFDEARIEKAMETYKGALGLDDAFVTAYNNLAYLYLERAKRSKDRSHKATDSKIAIQRLEAAQADLESAKEYCAKAIETDRTYAFAYDNLGNVWFELACLNFEDPARAVADFQEAEDSFRKATAFKSDYGAALNDRAKLHLKRVQCEIENSFWAPSDRNPSLSGRWTHI